MLSATTHLAVLAARLVHLDPLREDAADRGDVPGWVLVTVMTAGIVVAIAGVAGPMLTDMFTQAMSAVTVP